MSPDTATGPLGANSLLVENHCSVISCTEYSWLAGCAGEHVCKTNKISIWVLHWKLTYSVTSRALEGLWEGEKWFAMSSRFQLRNHVLVHDRGTVSEVESRLLECLCLSTSLVSEQKPTSCSSQKCYVEQSW